MASHKCPAPGCEVQVAAHMLACRPDWYRLPKALRDELWEAYRNRGHSPGRHLAAMADCAAWYRANPRQSGASRG